VLKSFLLSLTWEERLSTRKIILFYLEVSSYNNITYVALGQKREPIMNIGIFYDYQIPTSFKLYIDNIAKELANKDVTFIRFSGHEPLPGKVDLYWDPCCGGIRPPYRLLKFANKPVVVTVHGYSCALPFWENWQGMYDMFRTEIWKTKWRYVWKTLEKKIAAIITPSRDTKKVINNQLGLKDARIIPVWHGVDHDIFKPPPKEQQRKFLFNISDGCAPRKNLKRILEAYCKQTAKNKPQLVLKIKNCSNLKLIEGVKLNSDDIDCKQIASLVGVNLLGVLLLLPKFLWIT
jgi:glycosyltransferase involved in cell wall biosynthesis